MKNRFQKIKKLFATALACTMVATGLYAPAQVQAEEDVDAVPSEIMLASFFTSANDTTDTLYWSLDGINFYELCEAYKDAFPNDKRNWITNPNPAWNFDVSTLHDPSIMYKDGWFWMLSGFTRRDGNNVETFEPMLGYSKDLVHWSFPRSTSVYLSQQPPGAEKYGADWDMVAPDMFVDDDNSVYIVASYGYFASWHNDSPLNDIMKPYLVKGTVSIPAGADPSDIQKLNEPAIANYGQAVPINLPCMTSRPNIAHNHIDGSFYKEDGYYYFSVKENGVTDEIWRTRDLSRVSDASSWELVCDDVISGYEGPCLTKFANQYFFYTDMLETYVPVDSHQPFGHTGVHVVKGSSATTGKLDKYTGWLEENIKPINTYGANGQLKANRHGSVITLTGEAAQKVYNLAKTTRYADKLNTSRYNPSAWATGGWYKKESYRDPRISGNVVNYWYENDARAGVMPGNSSYRGKEIYDPSTDAWYWLEANRDGAIATAINEYDASGRLIKSGYDNGDCEVAQPVDQALYNQIGAERYGNDPTAWKWVRYDWQGRMIKSNNTDSPFYRSAKNGKWYRYDPITGAMVKGLFSIVAADGATVYCYFDPVTGQRTDNKTIKVNGYNYVFNEFGGLFEPDSGPISALPVIKYRSPNNPAADHKAENGWYRENGKSYWYENGVRQGYDAEDSRYRGKEIYDPSSDGWYWLDNNAQGAKAVSKFVYQESSVGRFAERKVWRMNGTLNEQASSGKWVCYDENGTMLKGWWKVNGKIYYFDPVYGTIAKGSVEIDGVNYTFHSSTGVLTSNNAPTDKIHRKEVTTTN